MPEVTLLVVILVLSVALQTAAAVTAAREAVKIDHHYRLAWIISALGLALMVERRISPLWQIFDTAELIPVTDATYGLIISMLLLIGVYSLASLLANTKSMADTDELTGLLNRRTVLKSISNEIERAMRSNRPIAFLMYDIDHFKMVNEKYGHPVGDLVLQGIANIALVTFRKIDAVGRIGGEEFLVVLPESDQEAARAAAERFRSAVAQHKFVAGYRRIGVTISIGVCVPETVTNSVTVETVLEATDKALYAAKHAGRNCIVVRSYKNVV